MAGVVGRVAELLLSVWRRRSALAFAYLTCEAYSYKSLDKADLASRPISEPCSPDMKFHIREIIFAALQAILILGIAMLLVLVFLRH